MSLPDLKLRAPAEDLAPLAKVLKDAGYTQSAISSLLDVVDLSQITSEHYPHYLWRCKKSKTPLARLVEFFFLTQWLTRKEVADLLPRDVLSALQMCGLLHRESGRLFCRVIIYPCLDQLFVTDLWASVEPQKPGHIYELGLDSYALARLTSRRGRKKALDLCTGSGIHGIQSALECEESTVVDINPRALNYTELNAAINGTSVERHLGDLYEPVKDRTFDLITVNPPFVPTPDREVLVHRSPGETGEEVSERLVQGLPTHLESGGLFSMILNYPILRGDDYLDRLERWLGQERGWIIVCMNLVFMELAPYIRAHMSPGKDVLTEFHRYLDSYEELGIEKMSLANVFIIRTDRDQPNHKVQFKSTPSYMGIRDNIDHWLNTQLVFSDQEFQAPDDWKPQQQKYIKNLWRNQDLSQGMIQTEEDNYVPVPELTGLEAERLDQLRGEKTCAELRQDWDLSPAELSEYLRQLGLKYTIETP